MQSGPVVAWAGALLVGLALARAVTEYQKVVRLAPKSKEQRQVVERVRSASAVGAPA